MWTEYDGTAAEAEMGEFLYGLIRMLKPKLVVETGTYKGYTTKQIGLALGLNGEGQLVTCEINPEYISAAGLHCDWHGGPIEFRHCSSLDLPELRTADLVFSDSDQNIRKDEYALVKPGCVFVVHDTDQSFNGQQPQDWLGQWVKSQGGLVFHAGRGFGILVKS